MTDKAPPILSLFRELVRDHLVDREGATALIPCAHEDLDRDVEFLAAGARRLGGALFNLSSEDDVWEAPPGPVSIEREALVQGVLAAAEPAIAGKIKIAMTRDGGVEAKVEAKPGPAEPSLTPILRCVSVIASSAYDTFDLVMLCANASPLDANRSELLWQLLTLDPIDLAPANGCRTIVPILGTKVDPEIDYRRRPQLQYVVTWDRVHRRSTGQQRRAIDAIAAKTDGPIVLFLGAGASASAKIPLGNAYRDFALERLVGKQSSSDAAARAFFDLVHEQRRFLPGDSQSRETFARELTLERVLRETFLELGYQPRSSSAIVQEITRDCEAALDYHRPGRQAIHDMASRLLGRIILATVNFDQLIETGMGTEHEVFFRPEDFRDGREALLAYAAGDDTQPVPILKLHGSIEQPESLVATIDTTSAGLSPDVLAALNGILEVSPKPLTWIWVGCSMRDRDVNLWLGGLGPDALDEWWVDPFPGEALDAFFDAHRTAKWSRIGAQPHDRVVIDSADGFLRALADRLNAGM